MTEEIKQYMQSKEMQKLIKDEIKSNIESLLEGVISKADIQNIRTKFLEYFNKLTKEDFAEKTVLLEMMEIRSEVKMLKKVLYELLQIHIANSCQEKEFIENLKKQYPKLEVSIFEI